MPRKPKGESDQIINQVAVLIKEGKTNSEIAQAIGLSKKSHASIEHWVSEAQKKDSNLPKGGERSSLIWANKDEGERRKFQRRISSSRTFDQRSESSRLGHQRRKAGRVMKFLFFL